MSEVVAIFGLAICCAKVNSVVCVPTGHFSGGETVTRAVWVPDAMTKDCMICAQRFSAFVRKHHCRQCGRVVCSSCSPHRLDLRLADSQRESKPERTCNECFQQHKKDQPAKSESLFVVLLARRSCLISTMCCIVHTVNSQLGSSPSSSSDSPPPPGTSVPCYNSVDMPHTLCTHMIHLLCVQQL